MSTYMIFLNTFKNFYKGAKFKKKNHGSNIINVKVVKDRLERTNRFSSIEFFSPKSRFLLLLRNIIHSSKHTSWSIDTGVLFLRSRRPYLTYYFFLSFFRKIRPLSSWVKSWIKLSPRRIVLSMVAISFILFFRSIIITWFFLRFVFSFNYYLTRSGWH